MARPLPKETLKDTIVARGTAPGAGAIAIVRLSGPEARAIASAVFHPRTEQHGEPGRMVLGKLHRPGKKETSIDEGFRVLWKAPRSYTGEDMAEFHLHGSPVTVSMAVEACQEAGARLADPGEFTRRAYLNGKLDLAQAEAVCDLITSQTESANRAALAQLAGGLSHRLASIREGLIPVVAELEASVDYPEEGLEFSARDRLAARMEECAGRIRDLLESARRGQHLRDGARVVLAGRPNSGKSSLFNLLLRKERALVTPHPGTTRDTVEAQIDFRGIPLTLIDTAGLREDPEEIEAMGIERALAELRAADLILFLVDRHSPPERASQEYQSVRELPHLVLANKADLEAGAEAGDLALRYNGTGRVGFLEISAVSREGFDALEEVMARRLCGTSAIAEQGSVVTNRRHAEALRRALSELEEAQQAIASGISPEFVVINVTEAVGWLDAIVGHQSLDEDVLDAIFSTFCLGK